MSYTAMFSFAFVNLPGLTLNAKLFDDTGVQTGSTITSGFDDLGDGAYQYLATIPNGHVGTLKIYDSAQPSRCIPLAVNPVEIELSAIVAALLAGDIETGHSLLVVLRSLYALLRNNSEADDPTNPTTADYYAPDGVTVRVHHDLTPTTRTVT